MNRTVYQWGVALAPLLVALLVELQSQLDSRAFDVWSLGSVATGAAATLVIALFNVVRADTEDQQSITGSGRAQ